jgi:c-di-AMP phosphodiesterase-like protein
MTYEEALTKAKELVGKANDIVIVTHAKPTMDSIGGSVALMLGLVSLGKKATVVCPDPMTVGLSGFVGVDRVVRDFGKRYFARLRRRIDRKVSYASKEKV